MFFRAFAFRRLPLAFFSSFCYNRRTALSAAVFGGFLMSFGEIALLAFGTVFLAEMGDKTQLLLVAMAGKYKVRQILVGTWLATILLNLLAVGIGAALSSYLDLRVIKSVAALAFFWFAWSGLRGENEAEEEAGASGRFGAVAAIFASFFIGELGDKTQLTGIALAASYANGLFANAAAVFLGCTLGLILADALGLLVGDDAAARFNVLDDVFSHAALAAEGLLGHFCLQTGSADGIAQTAHDVFLRIMQK